MHTTVKWSIVVFSSLIVAGIAVGCKKSTDSEPAEPKAQEEVAVVDKLPEPTMDYANEEALKMKLSLADRVDGNEDKVISRCPLCMLRMDGSEELAVEYSGYTVHLCSDYCKKSFEDDPESAILALKVDE